MPVNESYSGGIAAMDEKKFGYNDDPKEPVDIESGEIAPAYDDEGPVEFEEKKDLKRGLKQRHPDDCSRWNNWNSTFGRRFQRPSRCSP